MKYFIFLLLLSFIPLLDFLHPGFPLTHDGQDHVARIANFYRNLEEGNIIPRWAANLNWGYGHPILMFLYPLPSYIASFFYFLGLSLVDSLKIVFGLAFILSGFSMFIWLKEFLGEKAGILGAMLYFFAPYRFVDMYVRGAIGEHVAFIFPPLILFFLLQLSKKLTIYRIIGGSIAMAGLILSHNAITLMFLPVIFLYTLYLLFTSEEPKSLLRHLRGGTKSPLGGGVLMMFLGFGLSAFFWIPAFFEGKYTLRDIVTAGGYLSNFVRFQDLLYSPWNYGGTGQFSVQVGVVGWIVAILAIPISILFKNKKEKLWILTVSAFLIFITTLFLMISESKGVWQILTTLQKFQFPWRFLSVSVFATSLLGGLAMYAAPKKYQFTILILATVTILLANKEYWHVKDYLYKPEAFFTETYAGTTDTGESGPIWSVRFMEKVPNAYAEVIDGKAIVGEMTRKSTRHDYYVTADEKTRIRHNTLYFPGWEVLVDRKPVPIEFQDPANRGLITFYVEEGEHDVEVVFKETKLRQLANAISLLSLLLIGSLLFLKDIRLRIT